MAIAAGVICAWPSTAASIPSGWTRVTAWDTRYLRGAVAAGDAGAVGGAATHTHTSPSHTPTGNSHTHTITQTANATTDTGDTGGPVEGSLTTHVHSPFASVSANPVFGAATITLAATSNDLSYVGVVWIQSDGTPIGFPGSSLIYGEDDSIHAGWARVHTDRYLKGAAAAGDGGAIGGANTHTHTTPGHTHLINSHAHLTNTSPASNESGGFPSETPTLYIASKIHTHTVRLAVKILFTDSFVNTISTTTGEPAYKKLNCIQNGMGAPDIQPGMLALWGSTNASIPAEWVRYTVQDDLFVRNCAANGEVGTAGGAATHSHTSNQCASVSAAHNHTVTLLSGNSLQELVDVVATDYAADGHQHSWSNSSVAIIVNPVNVTVNASSSEASYPLWVRAIFIEYTPTVTAEYANRRMLMGVGI